MSSDRVREMDLIFRCSRGIHQDEASRLENFDGFENRHLEFLNDRVCDVAPAPLNGANGYEHAFPVNEKI
jgi:hypothetical protein